MKLKKKSGLMGAVIALSAASLVSVGFASWVISQGDSKTEQGQILVDTVENNIHLLTVEVDGNDAIAFKCNTPETAPTYNWLSNTDKTENLQVVFNVTITNADSTAPLTTVELKAGKLVDGSFQEDTKTTGSETGYAAAYAHGFVGQLPTPEVAAGSRSGEKDWKTTITLNFKWGSHFDEDNPFEFYNSHKAGDIISGTKTYAADAAESLDQLNKDLSGVYYQLTLVTE